jgi:hypothetical protein
MALRAVASRPTLAEQLVPRNGCDKIFANVVPHHDSEGTRDRTERP